MASQSDVYPEYSLSLLWWNIGLVALRAYRILCTGREPVTGKIAAVFPPWVAIFNLDEVDNVLLV